MADQEVRNLLLQINANTELLRSNIAAAERAVGEFQTKTSAHLEQGEKRFEAFGHAVEKLEGPLEQLKRTGETAFAFLLGESLVHRTREAFEFAGGVKFVSEQLGVSTDFLQKFRFAAGQAGASTQIADEGLGKFTRSIGQAADGNAKLVGTFDRLGVKVRDTNGNVRSTEVVYGDVADAIKKIDNPAQRTAATLALFGRGAIGLVPLLNQGAEGFDSLAKAAEQLGVVLSPELIAHSEEVNHKLTALKNIVDAQMASAIAQNAGAIETLAGAVVRAAGAFAQLTAQHPERALAALGALVGAKFGGVPGALIGAGAGYVGGKYLGDQNDENNNDLKFRKDKLQEARRRYYNDLQATAPTSILGGLVEFHQKDAPLADAAASAKRDYDHQRELYRRARRAPHENEGGEGSRGAGDTNDDGHELRDAQQRLASLEGLKVGRSGASLKAIDEEIAQEKRKIGYLKDGADAALAGSLANKEGGAIRSGESAAKRAEREAAAAARKAEAARQKQLSEDIAFESEQRRLRSELLTSMRKGTANDVLRDAFEKENIQAEADAFRKQTAEKLSKGDITKVRADLLLGLSEQVRKQKLENVDIEAASRGVRQRADVAQRELDNQITTLGLQSQIAKTVAQRRDIELKLLAAQQQAVRDGFDRVIADPKSSPQEVAQAKIDRAAAVAREPLERQVTEKQNQGVGQNFLDSLDPEKTKDKLDQVKVNGLNGISDGLLNVLNGTKSVSVGFSDMAKSILADLERIAIERAIIAPLANSLFGTSGGGSGGGILGSLFGRLFGGGDQSGGVSFASVGALPGLADGGHVTGPGGPRSDSILAALSNGEFIVNAASTARNLGLLHAINDNQLPKFANGGFVGARAIIPPRIPSASDLGVARSRGMNINQTFQLNAQGAILAADILDQIQSVGVQAAAGGSQMAQQDIADRQSQVIPI